MNNEHRKSVALFRLAVLGDLINTAIRHGDLRRALDSRAAQEWQHPDGAARMLSAKTIQSWLYLYRQHGFDGLIPERRRDKGTTRAIPDDLQEVILDMKREDPGRSVPLILRELTHAGRIRKGELSESAVRRLLVRRGLSGPKMKQHAVARHRFVAAECNDLWQGDACHGPQLFDPRAGRETRVKIFGLIDDKSRVITYLRASFHERQEDFLRVLFEAIRRRGLPRRILLDNHGSFTGSDVRVTCAQLGIQLAYARPRDGQSKGKIERCWRTLRDHVLRRLQPDAVTTLDDLNLRLMAWVDGDYNIRPHGGIDGRTPMSVFEEEAEYLRFLDDHAELESRFVAHIERVVRNDATCNVEGRVFEVPQHLRGQKVTLYYAVLHPNAFWILEGGLRVPVREVDPTANATRPRGSALPPRTSGQTPQSKPTGLNAVEGLLENKLRPRDVRDGAGGDGASGADDSEDEGGAMCARS